MDNATEPEVRKLILTVGYDQDTENPIENDEANGGFKFVSFRRRDSAYEDPSKYRNNPGLRRKLERNLAFVLDCYEHGGVRWSMTGEGQQCQWDTSRGAGLLIWTGKPKDLSMDMDQRLKSAKASLEEYNDWLNGQCFWYNLKRYISDEQPKEDVDSCGGFIGFDWLLQNIKENLTAGDYIKVKGELKDAIQDYQLEPATVVSDFDDEEVPENDVSECVCI